MYEALFQHLKKPALYEKGSAPFWDDPHISKGMLEAHLNAGWDGASRKHRFIERSVEWIAAVAPPDKYPRLLDLGCGPGLYTERFAKADYTVTGIDFSRRSIEYAETRNHLGKNSVTYLYQNYLAIDYREQFDIVTIIYCDYGALSPENRETFRANVFRALRPGGILIFDVFSINHFENERQGDFFEFCEDGGFWSESPYLCLNTYTRFSEEKILCRRHVVATETSANCYIVYDQCFGEETLKSELEDAGFACIGIFGDVAGRALTKKVTPSAVSLKNQNEEKRVKLRKKSEAEIIEFEKCHDGSGTVFCENMLKPEDSTYGYQWFHYDRVPAGTTIGEHLHEGSEEIYYLLEGSGVLLFNGETLSMNAGDISVVGDGETHGFINDSGADVVMIVVEIRPR